VAYLFFFLYGMAAMRCTTEKSGHIILIILCFFIDRLLLRKIFITDVLGSIVLDLSFYSHASDITMGQNRMHIWVEGKTRKVVFTRRAGKQDIQFGLSFHLAL
jgi:hypothetical protein